MKYAAYSKYKPSTMAWLDQMPNHWDAAALRWMSKRYSGGTPDKGNDAYWEDGEIPWINSGAVNDGYITQPSALITREGFANSSAKWIPKNTLVMALAGQGKTKGMVAQLGIPTTCNQSMAALIPDHRFAPRYLYHWLTANYQNIRNLAGGEARDGLNLEMLGSIPCPVPPIDEQQTIARFLDAKTAQIDDLLAKKRQLIDKLKEKRSALIARTVTRGLPPEAAEAAGLEPHPEMKDSGVEWMGKVPEQWDVVRVKFVAQVESGHTPSRSEPLYWIEEECVIPWVSLNDSKFLKENDFIGDTAVKISAEGMKNSSAHLLPAGAVVFTRDASIGLTAITTVPAAVSQHVIAWIPGKRVFQKYLLFVFKVMQKYLDSLTFGSTLKTIGMTDIRRITMPVPTIFEQQKISEFLDCETAQIGELMANIESAITRLTEYRQALITSAVTGKIDVRETPTLPEAA